MTPSEDASVEKRALQQAAPAGTRSARHIWSRRNMPKFIHYGPCPGAIATHYWVITSRGLAWFRAGRRFGFWSSVERAGNKYPFRQFARPWEVFDNTSYVSP